MNCSKLSDPAAERAVISAVFQHGVDCFLDVDDILTDGSMTVDSHAVVYRCFRHLFERDAALRPDPPAVRAAAHSLGLQGFFDDPEERKYLHSLASMPVERANVRSLAAKVRKLHIGREIGSEMEAAVRDLEGLTGEETAAMVLALVEGRLAAYTDTLSRGDAGSPPKPLGEGILAWCEHLAAYPVERIGIPTGFPEYDTALGGGLRKGSVNVIGARTGVGKSQIGINVALMLAAGAKYSWPKTDEVPRIPVLYLDTEMGEDDHRYRVVANVAGVPMKDIETGQFGQDPAKLEAVRRAADLVGSVPYDMKSIAGQPFEESLAMMRRWVTKRVGFGEDGKAKDCLIVFDYVKLMDASGLKNLQEYQQLGFMMTAMHNFAVKYGVPILTFVQLNRDGINAEDTSAASGSDRIMWLCTSFAIYKPQSEDELADQAGKGGKFYHKLVIVKKRHGPGLNQGDFIHMKSEYKYGRVTEGPTRDNYASGGFGSSGDGFGVAGVAESPEGDGFGP